MPITFAINASYRCQIFLVVHISMDSFEPYNTSILKTRHERHYGDGVGISRAVEVKMDCIFNFSWFSGMQMFRKAGTWF